MSNDKSAATYHGGQQPGSWWRELVKRASAWVIHLVARLQQRGNGQR